MQTSEKKETKTEEKPTTLVGGTLKEVDYGNYLIDKLVALDPQGRKATQGYIDAWNAITKTQENANKANSFLEDILVGMMPADKKPTAYADIREGFKKWQAGKTTTETKGEVKPTGKAEAKPEPTPIKTTEKKTINRNEGHKYRRLNPYPSYQNTLRKKIATRNKKNHRNGAER